MLNLILETLSVIGLVIWQIIQAIFLFFVPPSRKDVTNEVVFVTGAGSGLGRLLALKMAKLGSTVVCVDINKEANEATMNQIKSSGSEAFAYVCDCSRREDIYRVADLVKKEVGDVTILINNAGIVSGKKFMDTPDGLIQKTFEVNTMAHCWVSVLFVYFLCVLSISCTQQFVRKLCTFSFSTQVRLQCIFVTCQVEISVTLLIRNNTFFNTKRLWKYCY